MIKYKLLFIILILLTQCSPMKDKYDFEHLKRLEEQEREAMQQEAERNTAKFDSMKYFPCEIKPWDDKFRIEISSMVSGKYNRTFKKFNLYGNGYCWESITNEILNKYGQFPSKTVEVFGDSEFCFIDVENKEIAEEVAKLINEKFGNDKIAGKFLKEIDTQNLDC